MPLEPFEIAGSADEAVGTAAGVLVAFAGDGQKKMFRRRAIRRHADGHSEPIEALVAELDGVRAYVRRDRDDRLVVIVSRGDLYP